MATAFTDHAAYLATVPEPAQALLREILQTVQALMPQDRPCIGYQMPSFRAGADQGRVFSSCAAFKKHIGVYPPLTSDAALVAELAPWRNAKGNLAFALNQPMPVELIGRVAQALAARYAGAAPGFERRLGGRIAGRISAFTDV